MQGVRISSIKFSNFKSLRNYNISLHERNIIVGPNNAGKSTIISSLRLLEVALRRAKSKNAERFNLPNGMLVYGHRISLGNLSVSLENVATDYNSEDSLIEFKLSNRNKLYLLFPNDGGCTLYWETDGATVTTVSRFNTAFPISVQVVPVLGPLEHKEAYVSQETVREALSTHRASRHFRNYWNYFPEGWDAFSAMISSSWPGMQIKRPEMDLKNKQLSMFVSEDRIDREVYWAGFGFQIWCQLLTHISRANGATLLAIDEPEIYLHPDVQRQLLTIIRRLNADVVLATHSVEIIGEADPAEIVLVQKGRQSAQRLRDVEGIQSAIEAIGSAQNVTLAHLARTKKIVFVEGRDDFKTIRRFAKVLKFDELSTGNDLTAFESGGFTSWEKIKSFAWGVKRTIDSNIKIFAIYDRDYFCDEEVSKIEEDLGKDLTGAVVLSRKEMENYLLNVDVLQRVMDKQVEQKNRRQGTTIKPNKSMASYLSELTDIHRIEAQAQYIARKLDFHKASFLDGSTLSKRVMHDFEEKWADLHRRMEIIPGKVVLKALRDVVQNELGINMTLFQIIDEFNEEEVAVDLRELIDKIEFFRNS